MNYFTHTNELPISAKEVESETMKNPVLSKVWHYVTSSNTIKKLRYIFSAEGPPKECVSDNGPQLTSDEFKSFMEKNGIKHILVVPYHSSSNGAAERSVQIAKSDFEEVFD